MLQCQRQQGLKPGRVIILSSLSGIVLEKEPNYYYYSKDWWNFIQIHQYYTLDLNVTILFYLPHTRDVRVQIFIWFQTFLLFTKPLFQTFNALKSTSIQAFQNISDFFSQTLSHPWHTEVHTYMYMYMYNSFKLPSPTTFHGKLPFLCLDSFMCRCDCSIMLHYFYMQRSLSVFDIAFHYARHPTEFW